VRSRCSLALLHRCTVYTALLCLLALDVVFSRDSVAARFGRRDAEHASPRGAYLVCTLVELLVLGGFYRWWLCERASLTQYEYEYVFSCTRANANLSGGCFYFLIDFGRRARGDAFHRCALYFCSFAVIVPLLANRASEVFSVM